MVIARQERPKQSVINQRVRLQIASRSQ